VLSQEQLLRVAVITWTLILDPGRRILHHWIAPPEFNLGCRRWLGGDGIESIGQAISCAQAADFMISIDS
jgi:hypothetical protein